MKETDIRPDSLHKGQIKAFQHDIDRLLKHTNEFVEVNCPACQWDKWYCPIKKDELLYAKCPKCETIFISPRPTPQLLEDYYKNSEHYKYWSEYIFPQTEAKRREQIFKPRAQKVLELWRKYVDIMSSPPRGTVVDIGAGYGTFCEIINKHKAFKRVIAVEPSTLAKECRAKDIKTIAKPFEQITGIKADMVTAFELIEHLFSPQDFIKKCYEILTKNGLLILTCPNVQGFDIAVLKENSDQFNPEHLNYFNPKSLSLLLENNGFEVLEISTPGKLDVDIVKNKVAQKKYTPEPFIQSLLDTGEKFQQFLVDNNLSSHLWLVGRKK